MRKFLSISFICVVTLLFAKTAPAHTYSPEEISIVNFQESNPCVALNSSGASSFQDLLGRVNENMWASGSDFGGIEKMCAIDNDTRLLLFKPHALENADYPGFHSSFDYRDIDHPIDSQINRPMTVTVPGDQELIVAGYKTLYTPQCLGRDCDKRAWGGCMSGAFSGIDMDYYNKWQCPTRKIYAAHPPGHYVCYQDFSINGCEKYYNILTGRGYDWECPDEDYVLRDLREDPYAHEIAFGYASEVIGGSSFEESSKDHCEALVGANYTAWQRNDTNYSVGNSTTSKWVEFPYVSKLKLDQLDPEKSPVFDCDYFDSHGSSTICNPNEQSATNPYHAKIIFNATEPATDDFFNTGYKDLVFFVNGKLSLRYLDIHLKSKNSKVRFIGRGVVELIEVSVHGEAETDALVEFGPDLDIVLHKNDGRDSGPYAYGLKLVPEHLGIKSYIRGGSQIVDNLGAMTRNDPPVFAGDTELKLILPSNSSYSIPSPFYYEVPKEIIYGSAPAGKNKNNEFALCRLQREMGEEKECRLDEDVPRIVIAFESHDGGVNDRATKHFVEKRIDTPDSILTMVDKGFYYTLQGKPIILVENSGNENGIINLAAFARLAGLLLIHNDDDPPPTVETPCPDGWVRNDTGGCGPSATPPASLPDGTGVGGQRVGGNNDRGGSSGTEQEAGAVFNPWGANGQGASENSAGGSKMGCSLLPNSNFDGLSDFSFILLFLIALVLCRRKVHINNLLRLTTIW